MSLTLQSAHPAPSGAGIFFAPSTAIRGRHLLGLEGLSPATILEILDDHVRRDLRDRGEIQLTPALQELARRERYLAVQTNGRRYNIGVRYGALEAQVALAMAGVDRDVILARMMELLVQFEQDHAAAGAR